MKGYRVHRWDASFLIATCLLLLAGCQGLAPGSGNGGGNLTLSSSSLGFGTVTVGSIKTLQDQLTNSTSSSVTIASIQGTDPTFQLTGISFPLVLTAGQSSSFSVQFQPLSPGNPAANISFMGDGGQNYGPLVTSGTAVALGQLSASPSSIDFGRLQVGANAGQSVTLTNTGGTSVTISAASASGSGFSLSGLLLPLTLNAGQTTSFTVKFAPASPGAATGSVTITSNASNSPLSIPLSGTGVSQGALSPNPSTLSFGSVQVGTSTSLPETLTNTGGTSVTISAASASGSGFSLSGLVLPLTLNAGQTTSFTVKFAPASPGAATGSVTITSDASNSPLSIPLSGTGVSQGALSPNPSTLSFGSVQVGTSTSLPETLTNTGGTSVTISAASVSGSGFSLSGLLLPLTLNAGQTTSFTVKFAPASPGAATGSVTITSNASNSPLSIPLSGTGVSRGALSPNPSTLSFGSVQVGSNANLPETLTNTGGSSVTITQANVTGTAFSISGLTLPTTLTPTQSVTFTATFTPSGAGATSGTLSVVSDASNSPLNIPLSGTGTSAGQLAISPSSLDFGNVTVGSSSPLSASLTGSGAAVTVSSASVDSSEFTLSGITLPKTISAGQSAAFAVTFAPTATGKTTATLTFTSNASNSPTVQSLSGTGKAAPQHSVDLTWDASSGAVSYNVYRKISTDPSYTQINSGDTSTAYTDNSVTAGQTYDYVVTAVDSGGQESGYSSMAQAIIPNP